jgi:hypothetical protein
MMKLEFTRKKLISRVRPGVRLTLANAFLFTSRLRREDYPTFDRPANAISGSSDSGRHPSAEAMPPMNSSFRITRGSDPESPIVNAP